LYFAAIELIALCGEKRPFSVAVRAAMRTLRDIAETLSGGKAKSLLDCNSIIAQNEVILCN
jgi:hypothetical protein